MRIAFAELSESHARQPVVGPFERFHPLIVFEVCPQWLGRMNTSKAELFDELHAQGYSIHGLPTRNFTWGPPMASEDLDGMEADAWVNLVAAAPGALSKCGRIGSLLGRPFGPA